MSDKLPLGVSAHFRIDRDEETGLPFWRGAEEGWMDEEKFDPGEALKLDPAQFPVGTTIYVEGRGRGGECGHRGGDERNTWRNTAAAPFEYSSADN